MCERIVVHVFYDQHSNKYDESCDHAMLLSRHVSTHMYGRGHTLQHTATHCNTLQHTLKYTMQMNMSKVTIATFEIHHTDDIH